MKKWLIHLLFLTFLSLNGLCYAQEAETPAKTQEQHVDKPEKSDESTVEDLFDFGEAPVSYKGAFLRMMLTLLGLLALIVVSVWMLRRVSQGKMKQMNSGRSIKVIERRPLSAKSILYLVEIDGKRVVVAESHLEVRTIANLDTLPEEE